MHIGFHIRRKALSHGIEAMLRARAALMRDAPRHQDTAEPIPDILQSPEDFRPLHNACFQNPYPFYKMLRDGYPIYRLANGIYCVSRYEDIAAVSKNTDLFSSTYQGAIAGLRPGQSIVDLGKKQQRLADLGLIPGNVLALSDPPIHTSERKVAHKGLNSRFVKTLDGMVEALCQSMMDEFIDSGEVEFMQAFAWRLPMRVIIRLLGFPEDDYEKVKAWCVHGITTQSGIATHRELMVAQAELIAFVRYCWEQFLEAKRRPRDDLSAIFVEAVNDPDNVMTEAAAVSAMFQLLIAGSDSSATSMGNALKMLIENPDIYAELCADMSKLPAFIEEVFRLESAFQGHFRWVKQDTQLHGVELPAGSRLFLMWASGNRDEGVFENPDAIKLDRANGKKHLTFGHGVHACIGRELARSEIRIVLREFLRRTENLRINGSAPFQASMFAHTLVRLPIAFDRRPLV